MHAAFGLYQMDHDHTYVGVIVQFVIDKLWVLHLSCSGYSMNVQITQRALTGIAAIYTSDLFVLYT